MGAASAEKLAPAESPRVVWQPQSESQRLFLSCPLYECLLEGTRGALKTDALLMDFAQHVGQGFGAAWRGILFRKEYKDLADVVAKSKKWFYQIFPGALFLESNAQYKWKFPDGEELLLRAIKREDDYWNYHGHEYPWVGWEELCAWPSLRLYHDMKSCCRSSHSSVPRKYRSTTNPYGPGHNAVKLYFIDPAPPGRTIVEEGGRPRVRIHASIDESDFLRQADPDYTLGTVPRVQVLLISLVQGHDRLQRCVHDPPNSSPTSGSGAENGWRTGQRLTFQHNPNDIVDEKSTAYAAIKIPGLSHPRYQYVAGESRKIRFQLLFFEGPVKESVEWLRSLLYPEHDGKRLKSHPRVIAGGRRCRPGNEGIQN